MTKMARDTYAVVKDGKVSNVIVWDPDASPDYAKAVDGQLVLCTDLRVEVGNNFDGRNFIPPPPPAFDDAAKATYIRSVEVAFMRMQASMYVDAAKREELRLIALEIVQSISLTATHEDAQAAMQQGVSRMRSTIKELL